MKTLITWIGYREDFIQKTERSINILPSGFTGSIHKDIIEQYGFDKHLILFTQDETGSISKELHSRRYLLKDFLNNHYPDRNFEFVETGIDKNDL